MVHYLVQAWPCSTFPLCVCHEAWHGSCCPSAWQSCLSFGWKVSHHHHLARVWKGSTQPAAAGVKLQAMMTATSNAATMKLATSDKATCHEATKVQQAMRCKQWSRTGQWDVGSRGEGQWPALYPLKGPTSHWSISKHTHYHRPCSSSKEPSDHAQSWHDHSKEPSINAQCGTTTAAIM